MKTHVAQSFKKIKVRRGADQVIIFSAIRKLQEPATCSQSGLFVFSFLIIFSATRDYTTTRRRRFRQSF